MGVSLCISTASEPASACVVTLIATACKMGSLFQVILLVVFTTTLITANPWRDDLRCGPDFLNAAGEPAECNPFNEFGYRCCSPYGWCGKTKDHCNCGEKCIDYSVPWREDLRCGPKFLNANGDPAECNPFNEHGYRCCSPHAWCGKTKAHCTCDDCIDYSVPWREDLRCGPKFKNANGDAAECDPLNKHGYTCCSPHAWCGKTEAHCNCPDCIDYANRR